MASKKPLAIYSGEIAQLQSGDTLDAAVTEQEIYDATNSNAENINIGQAVYADGAGSVDLAQADASATKRAIGLVSDVTIASAASGAIKTSGILTATTGQWDSAAGTTGGLTENAVYYVSPDTAGMLEEGSSAATGEYVIAVGVGLSTTEMKIFSNVTPILL